MRAKFQVTNVQSFDHCERVTFRAVGKCGAYPEDGSDEDNTFSRFTPNAECTMDIANPALRGTLTVGARYYVDFTLVEPAP